MDSLASISTALIAFVVTSSLGIALIPFLRKLKFGQTILDIGPNWHKKKEGTPTMGGLLFAVGITLAALVGYYTYTLRMQGSVSEVVRMRFFGTLVLALGNCFIGFVDDYIKVVKKRNLGLSARQKLVMQFLVAIAYMAMLYLAGDTSTTLIIPFLGQWNIGILYFPLAVLGIVYITNSVNFTDGLDGLASSVTFVVAVGFMTISTMLGFYENALLSTALAGGCLGFLVWNFYPAKVFMGDTGSMYLGGYVVGLAFGIGMPLILAFIGIIYIVESLSVVLQVISFKSTGKRIFLMSPIHHHFEMKGNSEVKIVAMFSLVTLLGVLLAVLSIRIL